jgi:hypothetical protein
MVTTPRDTPAGRVFNDLRNLARQEGRATDELLVLYVLERWLYRAAVSPHADLLVLKGGLLLAALDARRPTRDGDLLACLRGDEDEVVRRICEIADIDVEDGVVFDVSEVRRASIREDGHYAGVRVTMPAALGRARVKLALDVNFGDPVTPGAVRVDYPLLLPATPFEVLAYPVETCSPTSSPSPNPCSAASWPIGAGIRSVGDGASQPDADLGPVDEGWGVLMH